MLNIQNYIANQVKALYPKYAQQKAVGLVLADYKISIGAQSNNRAFFVRNISMRSHVMAKLERDIFGCAGYLCRQSATFFSLATN